MDGILRNMTSIYITKGSKLLLLKRQGGRVVNDVWVGSAGGHFEPEELNDARACVLRELEEELGITETALHNIKMRYVTMRFTKGELRQNYYFFAELNDGVSMEFTSNEGELRWFEAYETTGLEMAYTARFVVDHYLAVGNKTDALYCGAADGKTVEFTEMPEF